MRRIRRLLNPVSTAATRLWCHSALRRRLLGLSPGQHKNPRDPLDRREVKAVGGPDRVRSLEHSNLYEHRQSERTFKSH